MNRAAISMIATMNTRLQFDDPVAADLQGRSFDGRGTDSSKENETIQVEVERIKAASKQTGMQQKIKITWIAVLGTMGAAIITGVCVISSAIITSTRSDSADRATMLAVIEHIEKSKLENDAKFAASLATWQQSNAELKSRVATNENSNGELRIAIAKYQESNSDLTLRIASLQKSLAESEGNIESLKSTIASLEAAKTQNEAKLKSTTAALQSVQNDSNRQHYSQPIYSNPKNQPSYSNIQKLSPPLYSAPKAGTEVSITEVSYDAEEGGRIGIRINLKVRIDGHKGQNCPCNVYFYWKDGSKLQLPTKRADGEYTSQEGQISVGTVLKPTYDSTAWQKIPLFIPLTELRLPTGNHALKFQAEVQSLSGTAVSEWQPFSCTQH